MIERIRQVNSKEIRKKVNKIISLERGYEPPLKKIFEQTPEERVFRHLSEGLLSNPNQLARELGLTVRTVNSTINHLTESGVIDVYNKGGAILIEEIHPEKLSVLPDKKSNGESVFFSNPKRGEKKARKKTKSRELVPVTKTFSQLEGHPDLESIRFWGKGKVSKNIKDLIRTGAIEIEIKKHPEKLEKCIKKKGSIMLFNLLMQHSALSTREIIEKLGWSTRKPYKEDEFHSNDKGINMNEMTPEMKPVFKTSVGRTFCLLKEKPDINSIMLWRGRSAENIEKLIQSGAIEIEIRKHPERLNLSPQQFHNEIPMPEKDKPSTRNTAVREFEKNNIKKRRLAYNWLNRIKATKRSTR